MDNLLTLATEGIKNRDLWYPTILGALVVIAAVGLFCGSAYLLLATDVGSRLGFLIAIAALSGMLTLLSCLWLSTTSPLNTLKGRIPSWKPVEQLANDDVARSKIPDVHDSAAQQQVDPTEATNVKAAIDQILVTPKGVGGAPPPTPTKYQTFQDATKYLVTKTQEVGGGGRFKETTQSSFPWVSLSLHKPKYAVVTYCPILKVDVPFGDAPPAPKCDPDQATRVMVLERDLGSVRVPPLVAMIAFSILFGISLLSLHWREKDLRELAKAEEPGGGTVVVPAKA